MSRRERGGSERALLDLWRPPEHAGAPLGCLATTYTFSPALFEEQCLARFLELNSEPEREDLAFLLERESRLGGVYAGVLADHTRAGVEHSLRWDVLPVRVPGARQHAKLSLLAWSRHVRLIVTSANLTEPGYRSNLEVAAAVELAEEKAEHEPLADALAFLRSLLRYVPAASQDAPEVERAAAFLGQVEQHVAGWRARAAGAWRRRLVCTLPASEPGGPARGSLDEALAACRRQGPSPHDVRVASPFFDAGPGAADLTTALCKGLARSTPRRVRFWVPATQEGDGPPRIGAPRTLLDTPSRYRTTVEFQRLPEHDAGGHARAWHAKLLMLRGEQYSALMIGSSNFTCAGLGVGGPRNAEANLLTLVEHVAYGREAGLLEAVWPPAQPLNDLEHAEWLDSPGDDGEALEAQSPPLPAGFLGATYRAGHDRCLLLRFDPPGLPDEWSVLAHGHGERELLSAAAWREQGRGARIEVAWEPETPPERLRVRWDAGEAFLALNVEDERALPPPAQLENMSADEMLAVLAAADPGAALRAWAGRNEPRGPFDPEFDPELDTAAPPDLDPLRRYRLETTFLHRVRHRARVLARLRQKLQEPSWSLPALAWRLRGLISVEAFMERLARAFVQAAQAGGEPDEALLALADGLIVLREVDYQPAPRALARADFDRVYRPFLAELAARLDEQIGPWRAQVAGDVAAFWVRVVKRCRS